MAMHHGRQLLLWLLASLQAAMALIRKDISGMPLSFNNFRD